MSFQFYPSLKFRRDFGIWINTEKSSVGKDEERKKKRRGGKYQTRTPCFSWSHLIMEDGLKQARKSNVDG